MSHRVLVANRGEIAIRVLRAVAELGWHGVAVSPADDAGSLHVRKADEARTLAGSGARAYLDIAEVVRAAREAQCDLVHPGYGFLSEREDFARACSAAGLNFVGPDAQTLEVLGDKAAARELAARCKVPLLRGTGALADEAAALAFLASLQGAPMILKAVGGGGGRGIRIVHRPEEVQEALSRCRSEAEAAFGHPGVYAEEFLPAARHIEVQVAADGQGGVVVLGERECTLQRRHQKVVEVAPSPWLSEAMRVQLFSCAERLARELGYRSLGTFEFLATGGPQGERFVFIEANPRLQVEHTVTEEVFGVDLVQLQLCVAAGERLESILPGAPLRARGAAIQLRVTMEQSRPDGTQVPGVGTLTAYDLPSGPGVRVDGCGYVGYANDPSYDPLLAKLIVHSADGRWEPLLRKAYRALCELRIEGIPTNAGLLRNLLQHPAVQRNTLHTRFIEEHQQALLSQATAHPDFAAPSPAREVAAASAEVQMPAGAIAVRAPSAGRIVELKVGVGAVVRAGDPMGVLESMKTEFSIEAERSGTVVAVLAATGGAVAQDAPIFALMPDEHADDGAAAAQATVDLEHIRADLQAVLDAHARLQDEARPEAAAKRHAAGQRTARENVADLCDPGSFTEYGALILAAQRTRRPLDELEKLSPADGLVAGIGSVNGAHFDAARTRCVVMAYDYTVFAGSQGYMAHEKKRRMLRLALKWRLPVVLFAEGGGGRPGDTDHLGGLRLFNPTFWGFARLTRRVPVVGIASGRCFAGNAALLAVCDLIVATEDASIGMGGPAMIEGGGLGVVAAADVGPVSMQSRNGVIDAVVRDEAEAVAVAKRYLSYFQGSLREWRCADQRELRHIVPEDPRRAYDMRRVIELLADEGSVLEMRRHYGTGVITSIVRIEGHAFAILANNPVHLSGAIDAAAAEKAARFIELAEAGGLPVVSLCDTPGFMVGPAAEAEGLVRRAGQMFVAGANLTVPFFTVVVRKAYGLGAVAMVGGNSHEQVFAVSWPTGHFGKMGLEGYVKLAYRKELEQIEDPQARTRRVDEMVAAMHAKGTALKTAPFLSIDDVIDPVDTRRWLVDGLITARQHRGDANFGPTEQPMF
ncbi:MAG: hypothetical protein RI988_3298 [Pseudomonadota bacterium]|jgi:acetyl/propionyl-CoA carboxylase alpha subunit/acetyl-CoA carboxylase carboxyltransferase component